MASPAITISLSQDGESDYGSDFSPEEEQIVERLLSTRQEDDNPIVTEVEAADPQTVLKLPRVLVSPTRFPLLQAIKAADAVASSIDQGGEFPETALFAFRLTDR